MKLEVRNSVKTLRLSIHIVPNSFGGNSYQFSGALFPWLCVHPFDNRASDYHFHICLSSYFLCNP